jgi:hypothetical protein
MISQVPTRASSSVNPDSLIYADLETRAKHRLVSDKNSADIALRTAAEISMYRKQVDEKVKKYETRLSVVYDQIETAVAVRDETYKKIEADKKAVHDARIAIKQLREKEQTAERYRRTKVAEQMEAARSAENEADMRAKAEIALNTEKLNSVRRMEWAAKCAESDAANIAQMTERTLVTEQMAAELRAQADAQVDVAIKLKSAANERLRATEEQRDDIIKSMHGRKLAPARWVRSTNWPDVLTQVYQEQYPLSDKYASGLGDAIRGSLYMVQWCDEHGVEPRICINHPIAQFLSAASIPIPANVAERVRFFAPNNIERVVMTDGAIDLYPKRGQDDWAFTTHVQNEQQINSRAFMFTIMLPRKDRITPEHISFVRSAFAVSPEIQTIAESLKNKMGVSRYTAIHVRCGDDYITNANKFSKSRIFALVNEIAAVKKHSKYPCMLLSDSTDVKKILHSAASLRDIHIHTLPVTHVGEEFDHSENQLRGTAVDYCLLSGASKIAAFTTYGHGTGFSQWCATLHNIPYTCVRLK